MSNWQKVTLGKILTESKVETENSDVNKRIRVLLNARGVIKRPVTKETKGATKYFERKKGQFIYGKQNLHKGAFGIVPKELNNFQSSSDLPAFDVDKSCLPEWLDYFLKQGNFYLSLIDIAKGAATKRIQPKSLFKIEIPLPSIEVQKEYIKTFQAKKLKEIQLKKEIQTQKTLLKNLKQSILQEAIEGKLTKEWRNQHPKTENASLLLERIKKEKQELIKAKKIKKEKPLPKIEENEVPFEIPKEWVWVKLRNICSKTGSGSTPKGGSSVYLGEGIKFIRSQNVYNEGLIKSGIVYISESTHNKMAGTQVEAEDLLLNITGGSIGRCCIVDKDFDTANINQHVAIIRSIILESGYYLHKVICSTYFQKEIINVQTGAGREGLPKNKMDNMLIPLPPLSEQQAIVKKVEQLMNFCSELEKEIEKSELHADLLMQSVLKEAFEVA